jgi:hypothetical protein
MIGVRPKSESHHLVIDSSLLIIDQNVSALSSRDARCVARGQNDRDEEPFIACVTQVRGARADGR